MVFCDLRDVREVAPFMSALDDPVQTQFVLMFLYIFQTQDLFAALSLELAPQFQAQVYVLELSVTRL
jgi:hypothetical protein